MQYSESDNDDFDYKEELKHSMSRSGQSQMSMEQPNMLLDMQTSQESQSNQFKYEQQNMMESIPEEYEEYKDEQSQQYSMMAGDGEFLFFYG